MNQSKWSTFKTKVKAAYFLLRDAVKNLFKKEPDYYTTMEVKRPLVDGNFDEQELDRKMVVLTGKYYIPENGKTSPRWDRINEAYTVLKDPSKRRLYNALIDKQSRRLELFIRSLQLVCLIVISILLYQNFYGIRII